MTQVVAQDHLAVDVQFEIVPTCHLDAFFLIACYSYGVYENLQDLCDTDEKHSVINTLGQCFTEFEAVVDASLATQYEQQLWTIQIGQEASADSIFELSSFIKVHLYGALACGSIGFRIIDESFKELLTVSEENGAVQLSSVTNTAWLGEHQVEFSAYLRDLDPSAVYA